MNDEGANDGAVILSELYESKNPLKEESDEFSDAFPGETRESRLRKATP